MMTPGEIRQMLPDAPTYKMSLGRHGDFRAEAFATGALLYQIDASFYEAVAQGDEAAILATGRKVVNESYPTAEVRPPVKAIQTWARAAREFTDLQLGALVIHWQADPGVLHWGITSGNTVLLREDENSLGARRLVFSHRLASGWRKASLAGVPLNDIHPSAKAFAANPATLSRVQTEADFFKTLIGDGNLDAWLGRTDWAAEAKAAGWTAKPAAVFVEQQQVKIAKPIVTEIADHFDAEIKRMASTALGTAAYANGQTVSMVVKAKDCSFTRPELEAEIHALLKRQGNACALTGYEFKEGFANPHLRPSLDRKDSSVGYVPGNIQVVTRAANYLKSASDEEDWALKALAMEKMAVAMQRKRKAAAAGS